ncbi:MAG: ExbD/TolR family protein [bacterium]|nr:ExbD/TolR family protein [bacterium]
MAFSLMPAGDEEPLLAEINVTPLVDVMMVLLIIFMIAAPMLHQGIEVNLPEADAETLPTRVDDPLVLSMNEQGLVFVQDKPIHPSQLVERLTPLLTARGDKSLFLKGDRDLPYGKIIEVLDILHNGGITQIGLVTEGT